MSQLLFSDTESFMLLWGPHSGGFIGFKLLLLSDCSPTLPLQIMSDTSVFLTEVLSTLLGIKHNTFPHLPTPAGTHRMSRDGQPESTWTFPGSMSLWAFCRIQQPRVISAVICF